MFCLFLICLWNGLRVLFVSFICITVNLLKKDYSFTSPYFYASKMLFLCVKLNMYCIISIQRKADFLSGMRIQNNRLFVQFA